MIRFATPADVPSIMKFLDVYWRKGHIFARDEKFFRYFFQEDDKVNFVISEENGIINAMEGFVPYGQTKRDIMLSMWKANHTGDPVLGIKIFDYIRKNADVRIMASPGINPETIPIYRYLGIHTGKMKHWYRLNKDAEYKNSIIKDNTVPPVENSSTRFKEFTTFDELTASMNMEKYKAANPKPYKENWYIKHKYFDHPVFHYYAFGVAQEDGTVNAVFFYRLHRRGRCMSLLWLIVSAILTTSLLSAQ